MYYQVSILFQLSVQQIYPVIKYQDMQQVPEVQSKQSGRWTKEEHQRFMYAIVQYGKDWKKVEQYVKTRSGSQVRSHAQKFFNKLQKIGNSHSQGEREKQEVELNRRPQQWSQSQFEIEREIHSEMTPSTPIQLVSLIRKQEKEGGKINLSNFKNSLQQHKQRCESGERANKVNPYKGMSNILSAFEQVNSQENIEQSQSFFISITKKYKRLFRQMQGFNSLIDINNVQINPQEASQRRKKSFTIPEGSGLDEEEIEGRIEEIKKKIHTTEKNEGNQLIREVRQRKESESSIHDMMPAINRLQTIQQQPKEQQQVSYKAIISQELLEELKHRKE